MNVAIGHFEALCYMRILGSLTCDVEYPDSVTICRKILLFQTNKDLGKEDIKCGRPV